MRAAIGALKFRPWWTEGWQRVVITTDSEYGSKGATEWLQRWARSSWRTSGGFMVTNKDLWMALSAAIGEYTRAGCEISFWRVPRSANTVADAAAKAAAERTDGRDRYCHAVATLV